MPARLSVFRGRVQTVMQFSQLSGGGGKPGTVTPREVGAETTLSLPLTSHVVEIGFLRFPTCPGLKWAAVGSYELLACGAG